METSSRESSQQVVTCIAACSATKEELQSSAAFVPVAVTVVAFSSATAWFRSVAAEALCLTREHVCATLRAFPVSWPNVTYSDSGRTNMCKIQKDSNSTHQLVFEYSQSELS